jgi:carboxypeptidase C (cathepsin A)
VDNEETLLTQTDLVFIDPVGTGFSRPSTAAYASDFYGVREDIAATREFIRVYRTRFDAWDAPIYLVGESYGTWRASGTAAAMEENGEHVAGVILISGGIPVGPVASPEMRAALFLPTRIATAAYHHRLAPELQRDTARAMREAEEWGRNVYAPALAKRDALTPNERRAIITRLARYTGLDTVIVDRKTLVVGRSAFTQNIASSGAVGMFDTRQIVRGQPSANDRANEARRRALIEGYLRDELGFRTDLAYQGVESGWAASGSARNPNAEWKWDQGEPGGPLILVDDGPPGGTPPWVQRTFASSHATRTFVAAGIYDSLNSCPLIAYQISRLEPALRQRITLGCYVGGHMIYEDTAARVSLRRDLGRFLDGASR